MWLFLVGVGLPVGLQTGRVLLAHLSTPLQLSQYALMAQIYAVCWSVLSTAGLAYWPIFVKRRAATEETVRMWWRLTGAFAGIAVIATRVHGAARPVGGNGAVGRANRRIGLACIGIRCVAGGAGRSPTGECPADQTE